MVNRLLETEKVRAMFPGLAPAELWAAASAFMDDLDANARSAPRAHRRGRRVS
jgi:hypothetical protein